MKSNKTRRQIARALSLRQDALMKYSNNQTEDNYQLIKQAECLLRLARMEHIEALEREAALSRLIARYRSAA